MLLLSACVLNEAYFSYPAIVPAMTVGLMLDSKMPTKRLVSYCTFMCILHVCTKGAYIVYYIQTLSH